MFCPKMKNEEDEEKEEDSSLYSRSPWIWATTCYGRECTWPRTPLLTHACACATTPGQVKLSSPNTIARAQASPTHTHARAPPLGFPALVQFLRFASYSIFRHFILIYYTYICVYVHSCPQHMSTRTSLATHALVTHALATHALATHACACGTTHSPFEHHTPSRKHVQVINYPNGCSTEIQWKIRVVTFSPP